MATSIIKALGVGYTPLAILDYVAKKSPKYSKQISKALTYGYTAATILNQIIGNTTGNYDNEEKFMTPYERGEKHERNFDLKAKGQLAAGVGALAAAGIGLPAMAAMQEGAPEEVMGASPQGQPPSSLLQREQQNLQAQEEELEEPDALKRAQEAINVLDTPSKEEAPVLNQFPHLIKKAEDLLSAGRAPDETYEVLHSSKLYSPLVDAYEKQSGSSFMEKIATLSPESGEIEEEVVKPIPAAEKEKGADSFSPQMNKAIQIMENRIKILEKKKASAQKPAQKEIQKEIDLQKKNLEKLKAKGETQARKKEKASSAQSKAEGRKKAKKSSKLTSTLDALEQLLDSLEKR